MRHYFISMWMIFTKKEKKNPTRFGKNVEKLEYFCTVGGMQNDAAALVNSERDTSAPMFTATLFAITKMQT